MKRKLTILLFMAALLGAWAGCTKSDSPAAASSSGSSGSTAPTSTPTKTWTPLFTYTPTVTPVVTYPFGTAYGQSGGDGINGDFGQPAGIAITKDGVYTAVSDVSSGNIQIFNSNGTYLYEIDSTNDSALITAPNQPWGMTFDAGRNLYVADVNTGEVDVYNITLTSATWTGYYVGGGAITGPMDVKFDANGNLVVADSGSGHTYNIDFSNDTVLNTATGDGGGLNPSGVAVDSVGNFYVSDQNNDYVFAYGPDYQFHYAFNGNFQGWPTPLGAPAGIVVDKEGDLLIADFANQQVVRTNLYGVYSENIGAGTVNQPDYLALVQSGTGAGNLYVTDFGLDQFLKFTPQ